MLNPRSGPSLTDALTNSLGEKHSCLWQALSHSAGPKHRTHMTHNRRKSRKQAKASPSNKDKIALAILILTAVAISYGIHRWRSSASEPAVPAETAATPSLAGRPGALERDENVATPLPQTLSPENFANNSVAAHAYQVAQQIPRVLVEQPCFCDCGQFGHRSLLDCYKTNHAAG